MKSSLLLTGLCLTAAQPVWAAAESPSPVPAISASTPDAGNYDALYLLSSQMLGHAAMAQAALVFGLYNEAADPLAKAQSEAADLMTKTPAYNAAYAGTSAARTLPNGAQSDYLLPVVSADFTEHNVSGKHVDSANPKIEVADAQNVHYTLLLDTKQANDAVSQAKSAFDQQHYEQAFDALSSIGKGAILEASGYETPLAAVRDNLLLAQAEIGNKQYKSASYALSHAQSELKRAQKENPKLSSDQDTKDMQQQISDLQAEIAKDDPSAWQKAKAKIAGWLKGVDSHLKTKS